MQLSTGTEDSPSSGMAHRCAMNTAKPIANGARTYEDGNRAVRGHAKHARRSCMQQLRVMTGGGCLSEPGYELPSGRARSPWRRKW